MFILWGKNHSLTGGSGLYKPKASPAVLKISRLNTLEKLSFRKAYLCCLKQGFSLQTLAVSLPLWYTLEKERQD